MNVRTTVILLAGALCLCPPSRAETPVYPAACEGCTPACRQRPLTNNFEFNADLLLWWTKAAPLPGLATTSAPADLGLLTAPTTVPVVGGTSAGFGIRPGARFGGRYLSDDTVGVEVSGFWLENGSASRFAGGLPVLAAPTINARTGADTSVLLASPGVTTGSAQLDLTNQLWGLNLGGVYRMRDEDGFFLDLTLGYRFLQISETLAYRTTSTVFGPGLFAGQVTPPNSTYQGVDAFSTRNNFHGGEIGARGTFLFGKVTVGGHASLGVGSVHQVLHINGATTVLRPGLPPVTAPGNVYAQVTNIGGYSRGYLCFLPQAGLSAGYQVTKNVRVSAGYDVLYVTEVLRPGKQVDPQVDPSLPPILGGTPRPEAVRPAVVLSSSDFWAQGLTFRLELTY